MDNDDTICQIAAIAAQKIGLNPCAMTQAGWMKVIKYRMAACHCENLQDYFHKVTHSSREMEELIDLVIVPETWFFRDRSSFDFLVHYLKHHWMQRAERSRVFRILSVPCSTGEEPYSIAMTMLRAGIPPALFHIDAVDISKKSIETAIKGIYGKNSFRGKDIQFRSSFFKPIEEKFALLPAVREQVSFYQHNVFDPEFCRGQDPYQAIFCRNLLIYLDSQYQRRLLEILSSKLDPVGILIVGPVEAELLRSLGYESHSSLKSFAFIRKPALSKKVKSSAATAKGNYPLREEVKTDYSSKINLPFSKEKPTAFLLEEAGRYANLGKFQEATASCLKYLKENGPSAEGYFLLGVIEHATHHEDLAEELFLKTIYLNPYHYTALVYLTLLAEKKGDISQAELFRQRAIRSATLFGNTSGQKDKKLSRD